MNNNDQLLANEKEHAFPELSAQVLSTRGLRCAHLNVNGLFHKIEQIKTLLNECKFDVLAITETHLSKDVEDNKIKVPNYEFIRKDRKDA